ncbi:MAG TPA: hypothetical protein VKB51_14655 [bacterium]|nr:hypothetical protein [bacterium]
MADLVLTLVAGVVATALMPLGLYALPPFGLLSPPEQARAFGSFMTRREDNALIRGLVLGIVVGLVWAFVYAALLSVFGHKTMGAYILLGFLFGAFFGESLSMATALVFADNHPIPRFQENAWRIALGTVMIHIVHGVVMGVMLGAYGVDYAFIPKLILLQ